jgi:uncharacterized protein (TIGR03492 family)
MKHRVLFISNGHGEDLNASIIIRELKKRSPEIEVAAIAIVGDGIAYRRMGVPIIAPTKATMPSGGFAYMETRLMLADIADGLLGRLWQQGMAARKFAKSGGFIFTVGDGVVLAMAALAGLPYGSYLVSTSAYYIGSWPDDRFKEYLISSSQCKLLFTRDNFTAKSLYKIGIESAQFVGNPFMDIMEPKGVDLDCQENTPIVALLPGSRFPEAIENLQILLPLTIELTRRNENNIPQLIMAAVPSMLDFQIGEEKEFDRTIAAMNWEYDEKNALTHPATGVKVRLYVDAFADIIFKSDIVVGMAGTAIEQAVGRGKPIVQIPGGGPQFTHQFAVSQMRLLGNSVRTIDDFTMPEKIIAAAEAIEDILQDTRYRNDCIANGIDRVGHPGGAAEIARQILATIEGK